MTSTIKITFPKPLSHESWKLIIEENPLVELITSENKKIKLEHNGTQISEPIEMWYNVPENVVILQIKERKKY